MESTNGKINIEAGETATVFDEYVQRLNEAIQRDRDRLLSQAENESTEIISGAKQKAEQIVAAARESAKKEAEQILSEAGQKAALSITEDRGVLWREFEESITVAAETKQKLEQFILLAEGKTGKSPGNNGKQPSNSTKVKTDERNLSLGTVALHLNPPVKAWQIDKLQKNLHQIPGLQIVSVDNTNGEGAKMTVFIPKATPLVDMLRDMSLVKDIFTGESDIRLTLKPTVV